MRPFVVYTMTPISILCNMILALNEVHILLQRWQIILFHKVLKVIKLLLINYFTEDVRGRL